MVLYVWGVIFCFKFRKKKTKKKKCPILVGNFICRIYHYNHLTLLRLVVGLCFIVCREIKRFSLPGVLPPELVQLPYLQNM
jgi:hypothetical protein